VYMSANQGVARILGPAGNHDRAQDGCMWVWICMRGRTGLVVSCPLTASRTGSAGKHKSNQLRYVRRRVEIVT
jgi:hypothetical protein